MDMPASADHAGINSGGIEGTSGDAAASWNGGALTVGLDALAAPIHVKKVPDLQRRAGYLSCVLKRLTLPGPS